MFKNLPDPQLLNSSLHLSFHASHTVKDSLISVCQIAANSICSQYFLPYGKISHNLYTNPVTGIQAVYKLHGKQKNMPLLLRFRKTTPLDQYLLFSFILFPTFPISITRLLVSTPEKTQEFPQPWLKKYLFRD